jgi:hypothetical protein
MEVCIDPEIDATKKARLGRMEYVKKVGTINGLLAQGISKTAVSEQLSVPRTTLSYWVSRKGKTGLSPLVEDFFETPDGLAFLHQLIIAAQFVMNKVGPCGADLVSLFLELSQLNRFVAGSHGSMHKVSVNMEEAIMAFGKKEGARLSTSMPKKKISICQDETFHPSICLVAIEPVSNFILLEKYDEKRDSEAWSKSMQVEMERLPVTIIQSTSDEGRGLVKYVEKELGVHHSPDLFHVQQELTRATSAPLRSKVKQAEAASQAFSDAINHLERAHEQYAEANKAPCPWSELEAQMIKAKAEETAAQHHVQVVKKYQMEVKVAKKALGDVYHPYDLHTGKAQTAEEISDKLEEHFCVIKTAAEVTELSENSLKRLDKAHRVFKSMINTIVFFWKMVKEQIAPLGYSPELEKVMHDILIPGYYLQHAAKKAKNAAERHRIKKLADEILARIELLDGWCNLAESERETMKNIAEQCAQLFQRSSSCVEGRNGYLALRHHSSHQMSDRKLGTLTVIHNYFIKRPDGSTPAERFFEQKPENLFRFLLDNLSLPARPAKRRKEVAMAA